ncbi:MAG: molecular chaperone DnaK (HSP70) [Pseudohongiellaceae bacterium]|jgi:molecular chaperone DnaK (HSP70)
MANKAPEFLIGIDLGTTNTVVAYADMAKPLDPKNCHIFEIEQLIAPGEIAKRPQLPSFRYHPTKGELTLHDTLLPWTEKLANDLPLVIVGEWARELGAKVDGRHVVSAKSWLSHPQVDRSADILPWGSTEEAYKVSPILASASYLFHVRQAWNTAHPHALIEDQEVVITIPASFDESARAFTVEAAKLAGLPNILLLEEPQAVCYDWYARQGEYAQAQLKKFKLLMVCDVGGGTTDLSLIKIAKDKDDALTLTRVGVGNHLMLGGDNVDLALAHTVEQKINKPSEQAGKQPIKKLSTASLSQLIQQTRQAKETLLSANPPESKKVTLLGSGSKLIGGSKSYLLSRKEVSDLALEGFFPLSDINEHPVKRRSAMLEFGLPYAPDPAVSKYLAQFISEHQVACRDALGLSNDKQVNDKTIATPDALLLNGGVFNSNALHQRAQNLLTKWHKSEITLLENTSPDLAVAQGAVAYAKARRGAQLKIGGGSARTFFLVLEKADTHQQVICLMPKGTEENQEYLLNERKFSLRLGQPVQFNLLSSTADHNYQAGELITVDNQAIDSQHYISLPPLIVALNPEMLSKTQGEHSSGEAIENEEIAVSLATTLTEIGTLQLDCVANNTQRWHVEFQVRKHEDNKATDDAKLPAAFSEVQQQLNAVFHKNKKQTDPKAIKTLRIDIEKNLGKREKWDIPLLRALFDQLLDCHKNSKHSSSHERIWFNLAGYSLRPGFGYPADAWRIEQVWKLHQQGLQFDNDTQAWIDWWTFWRRAAGGLNAQQQISLYKDITRFIKPSALTSRKLQIEAKQKSYEDMVKLVATLEHLPIQDKTQVSQWLLKRLEKPAETKTSWWALGRIASRIPFHGSAHNVIPKESIQSWLPQLLNADWKKEQQIAFACVLMSRMSGDRSRDVDEEWRHKIIKKLNSAKAPSSWVEMLEQVKTLDEKETKRVFGEGLPPGLKLLQ